MRRSNTNAAGARLPPPPIGAAATPGRPAASIPAEEDLCDSDDYSADSDDDEERRVVRVAANYYDDGPAETEPDEYDKEEDARDNEVVKHWMQWSEITERNCIYPVVLPEPVTKESKELKASIIEVLDREEVRSVSLREVPRFGRNNFDGRLGQLEVVFVNGDELDDIKKKFRGNSVNVQAQDEVRTAFAPSKVRSSFRPAAPAPVPIRDDGPSTQRNREDGERRDAPPRRRDELRDEPRRQREEPRRERDERIVDPPRRERDEPRRQRDEPRREREDRRDDQPRRRRLTAAEIAAEEQRRRGAA